MQAARGFVDFGVEFAAGVQRAHDHFERRLVLELGMRVDRDAAAIVGDGDEAVRLHLDFDPVGVAGQRLVHRIVDHLGEQMMQRLFVGAADIHAGAAAHGLQAPPAPRCAWRCSRSRRCRRARRACGAAAGLPRLARGLRGLCARSISPPGAVSNRSGCSGDFFLVADLAMGVLDRMTRFVRQPLCHDGGGTVTVRLPWF